MFSASLCVGAGSADGQNYFFREKGEGFEKNFLLLPSAPQTPSTSAVVRLKSLDTHKKITLSSQQQTPHQREGMNTPPLSSNTRFANDARTPRFIFKIRMVGYSCGYCFPMHYVYLLCTPIVFFEDPSGEKIDPNGEKVSFKR